MIIRKFHEPDESVDELFTLGEFWQWAMSDLLGNTNRGVLAEYIVGKSIGASDLHQPRLDWDCYDLMYQGYRIQVKASAYVQSWHVKGIEERSKPTFGVRMHQCWDARTNTTLSEKKRYADCYVFCVFPIERDDPTRDVLDLSKWGFYITSTKNLESHISDETQSIGINRVQKICGAPVGYQEIRAKIDLALGLQAP